MRGETDGHIAVLWPTHGFDTACTGEVAHREVERCDDAGALRRKTSR